MNQNEILKNLKRGFAGALLLSLLTGGVQVYAGTKIAFDESGTVVKEIKFGGDFRFRQENNDYDPQSSNVDRQRQRIRLRLSTDITLPSKVTVKTRLATGTGEQVSTNQTLDGNGSQKQIWLDRAYLNWKPFAWLHGNAGKMANPFWQPYSADNIWDTDYNPEGLSQSAEGVFHGVGLFANFGQFAINEQSSNAKDIYLFSEQGGFEVKLPVESRLKAAVAHHEWANSQSGPLGGNVTNSGNSRTAGVLDNHFSILEFTGLVTSWIGKLPVSIDGSYQKNNAHKDAAAGTEKQDTAYQYGVRIGKASKKNTFEVALYNKSIRKDAVVDEVTDSDFGGTNRKGWIGWAGYALTDWAKVKVKYFDTKKIVYTGSSDVQKKAQFDLETKW